MGQQFEDLLIRFDHLASRSAEVRGWTRQAIAIAELDAEMALTRVRKVLEFMVRQLYERRINEPPGTRPLDQLLQRIVKDDHLPKRLAAYANAVRELGNVGTHSFGEPVTIEDVRQSLAQLLPVVEWYCEQDFVEENSKTLADTATGRKTAQPMAGIPTPRPADPARVIPKGIRSFDHNDSEFFLQLLPGPRDQNGLPAGIRFWKNRIEPTKELTFTVGLIYGPSGCGKSSLVKAGLLPRLADHVRPIYVEATADQTEARVMHALREHCPGLWPDASLADAVSVLRTTDALSPGHKIVLILDQFEQWLHGTRAEEDCELVRALRQCDGQHVQAILMVRDDFWLAISRFLAELDVRLVEGENMALVDLFDKLHARKVLALFGRAYGRLPEDLNAMTHEQVAFLDQAVAGLAEEHKVISVRLSLFAEMVKGKPWTPQSLQAVGGTEGVGVTFLEETFSARTANPEHRRYEGPARHTLAALLPEAGSDIKGRMRARADLLHASGLEQEPEQFERLLKMLDMELRIITPTEPGVEARTTTRSSAGLTASSSAAGPTPPASRASSAALVPPLSAAPAFYQLTHDYLVPSLRQWLTRKQKETRRGRAELRLAERAALWNAKPENRLLPAWWEWLNIQLLTRKKDWTPSQQTMMRKSTRDQVLRGTALFAVMLAIGLLGLTLRSRMIEQDKANYAAGLVHRLLDAEIAQLPAIIQEMKDYRPWIEPRLKEAQAESASAQQQAKTEAERVTQARRQMYASLALLPNDPAQVEFLYGCLLNAEPPEVAVIRDALLDHKQALVDRLWTVVEQPEPGRESQRLRAACALALYDPANSRWDEVGTAVVGQIVSVSPVFLATWMDGLRPVQAKLLGPLTVVFHDHSAEHTSERTLATNILADYASGRPDVLANLVMDADEKQFLVLFPKLEIYAAAAVTRFEEELTRQISVSATDEDSEELAKRQANAGVGLLKLSRPQKVWPLLKHSRDPRVRSYLVHRLGPMRIQPRTIVKRLRQEREVSTREALLLVLGEFGPDQLSLTDREPIILTVLQMYRDDPDSGLHGACAWLLGQWGQQHRLAEIDRQLATGKVEGDRRWYINGQGQTMAIIVGPIEFVMGSPPTEEGREGGRDGQFELPHPKRIGRSFAIAAREVTVEQFLRFRNNHPYNAQFAPTTDRPVNNVSWYDATAYCNWLSEQERIPKDQWCYLANDGGEFAEGMTLAANYFERTGYRLPSEAEWEFACRAGAVTSRYFGETQELLGKFAWYIRDSKERWMLPVGSLKPNDLGLFDMLGNAWERCQERYAAYQTDTDDKEDQKNPKDTEERVMRGGSLYRVLSLRCADRNKDQPTSQHDYIGFRPARTVR